MLVTPERPPLPPPFPHPFPHHTQPSVSPQWPRSLGCDPQQSWGFQSEHQRARQGRPVPAMRAQGHHRPGAGGTWERLQRTILGRQSAARSETPDVREQVCMGHGGRGRVEEEGGGKGAATRVRECWGQTRDARGARPGQTEQQGQQPSLTTPPPSSRVHMHTHTHMLVHTHLLMQTHTHGTIH